MGGTSASRTSRARVFKLTHYLNFRSAASIPQFGYNRPLVLCKIQMRSALFEEVSVETHCRLHKNWIAWSRPDGSPHGHKSHQGRLLSHGLESHLLAYG